MTFLYTDGTDAHFMDTESYEQMAVPEAARRRGAALDQAQRRGRRALHRRPAQRPAAAGSVELEVSQTDPGLRGDTASGGGTKPATLETGATINVPLFVDIGDVIGPACAARYISRASQHHHPPALQQPLVGTISTARVLEVDQAEVSGGGCFDAAVQKGTESPRERIRGIKTRCRTTPLQMALRGWFLAAAVRRSGAPLHPLRGRERASRSSGCTGTTWTEP